MINVCVLSNNNRLSNALNKDYNIIDNISNIESEMLTFLDVIVVDNRGNGYCYLDEILNLTYNWDISLILVYDTLVEVYKKGKSKVLNGHFTDVDVSNIVDEIVNDIERNEVEINYRESKRLYYNIKNSAEFLLMYFCIDMNTSLDVYNKIFKIIWHTVTRLLSNYEKGFSMYNIRRNKSVLLMEIDNLTEYKIKQLVSMLYNKVLNELKKEFSDICLYSGIAYSRESENVLQDADNALKAAKNSHSHFAIYNKSLKETIPMEFKNKLELAFKEDRIILYFQPIFNNETKTIECYEALVRLMDENGQVRSPFEFLQIAKELGVYDIITKTVILKALDAVKEYNAYISVNISYDDIANIDTRSFIIDILEQNKDIAYHLGFELTEVEKFEDYNLVRHFIQNVKSYGCKIYVDDFGSGYSNYLQVAKLDVDCLKIDGEIIKEINNDRNSVALVKSIVAFSKDVGIKTVAEYVSDKSTFDMVVGLGIDFSQGYHIGKPMDSIGVLSRGCIVES